MELNTKKCGVNALQVFGFLVLVFAQFMHGNLDLWSYVAYVAIVILIMY